MATEAFAGSLCEGELGALSRFSGVAAALDFGLLPRVTMVKNCIYNLFYFIVWKRWRIFVMAFCFLQEQRGGPDEARRLSPVLQSNCCGSGAAMLIIHTVIFIFLVNLLMVTVSNNFRKMFNHGSLDWSPMR